jgi:aldehyde dehydrogenase (NAD+)
VDPVLRTFERLRANRWAVAATSAEQRIAKLTRVRDAVLARREELLRAIHEDYKKNPGEVDLTEVFTTYSEANDAIRHLRTWMRPQRVPAPLALFGTHSAIRYEAKGTVLILAPWNYPFSLLMCPLISAVAAGNCVAVRPSSKVPNTARFLKRFISDLFPEDEVAVFEGDHKVSDALLELPFDHIFFTGSPGIGKKVMTAAAKNLASVTLELGGKSPVVVDRSADVVKAAERIMWGKFVNAGQTCVAPDYLLIHGSRVEEFVAASKRVLADRYGKTEEEQKSSPSFCRLVSSEHHRGLLVVLEAAVAAGAKVEVGGRSDPAERYLAPTLLSGVDERSPIMKEEIFGPILPILAYQDLGDAIRIIQSRPKPLALYVFAKDQGAVERVLGSTSAGGSCVNTVMLHLGNPNLPFGGVGNSGLGNYHGQFGFKAFSHERAVLEQGPIDSLRFFYPPYTDRVRGLIKTAIEYLG